jgi:hypothetical protein
MVLDQRIEIPDSDWDERIFGFGGRMGIRRAPYY